MDTLPLPLLFRPDKCSDSKLDVCITALGHVLLNALFSIHHIIWCYMYSAVENVMKYRTVMYENKYNCY